MGVRGLTTFVNQNSNHFYQPFQLHDCTLVIDGCSLACQLYNHTSNCNSAFGGDYDLYAKAIEGFLGLLGQCHVKPVVVIDGGYEARKLNTVLRRFKDKIYNAKVCNPVNQLTVNVFPLFLMEVFKQTLISQGIKFVQADFEADYEIAAIARHLNCPVLSNDSDFYIYDVLYIPFPTLNLVPLKLQKKGCLKYYLGCEVYQVEKFISKFGGLDKFLLPLVAVLLGNDYVPASTFCKLFADQVLLLKSKKMSLQHRKIVAIFELLKNETLDSATTKILNHLKKKDRNYVKRQIDLYVSSYSYQSSDIITYLDLQDQNSDSAASVETQLYQCNDTDLDTDYNFSKESKSSDKSANENISDDEIECDLVEEFDSHVLHLPHEGFPLWLKDKFRRGELPPFLSDIYHLHLYVCQPQVEDFTLYDSHLLSFPILQVICGLLLFDSHGKSAGNVDCNLICHSRGATSSCQMIELKPIRSLPCLPCFPPISCLPKLPFSVRKNVFYSTLGIFKVNEMVMLESFGGKWGLFAAAVVFWARSATSPIVTHCHLQAIIICMIALGVVDEKLDCIRSKKEVTIRKIESLESVHQQSPDKNDEVSPDHGNVGSHVDLNKSDQTLVEPLGNYLTKVSESECLSIAECFLQFHHTDSKLRNNPQQFSPVIVHVFAQLQACLLQAMSLNALLGNPLPQCQVSEIFSGTIAYIAFVNFNKSKDVEAYAMALMSSSPSVYAVYKALLDKFSSLLPNVPVMIHEGTKKTKSKKHKKNVAEKQDVSCLDLNNKFALLADLSCT